MKINYCLILLLVFACSLTFAQKKSSFFGIRAGTTNAGLLSKDSFDSDGFNSHNSYSAGFTFSRIHEGGRNIWTGFTTGLSYRRMNMTGKTYTTSFNLNWVELPFDLNMAWGLSGWIPFGFTFGANVAVPLQYKGSVQRPNLPNYEYGSQKYEKPAVIFGLRMGPTFTFRISHIYTTLFAHYNLNLIALGKNPPDGVERAYKVPLPTFFELGLAINYSKMKFTGEK